MSLTREQIEELFERSKNDRAIIVGSEVRQLAAMALQSASLAEQLEEAKRWREAAEKHLSNMIEISDRHKAWAEAAERLNAELVERCILTINRVLGAGATSAYLNAKIRALNAAPEPQPRGQ